MDVHSPPATLTGMWCPRCGERALDAPVAGATPASVHCAACGADHEALADVTVLADSIRQVGGCCAGFARHTLSWEDRAGAQGTTEFETWVQDRLMLRTGDRVSLLFPPGELARPKDFPMPLTAANHTLGASWALVGAAPGELLR